MAAVLLTHSERAAAQATANAVVAAEDAFGSSEGDESVGIYDQTSVRGFNLESAGNYRIDGRYFVKNSGVSNFFVERTTIRIGYNALSLDYAGPSGVVDYKLRDPTRGEPSQATIGVDPFEQPFAEVHVKYRNPAEDFSASLGASSRFHWANEQGGEGKDVLLAGTTRFSINDTARLQIFGGEYRYRRNGRFQIALAPDNDALPAPIERGRYLGQSWASEEGARRIVGALADMTFEQGWSARAIGVFSQEAPDSKFTQRFFVTAGEPLVRSSYIISPVQRSSSSSGELRLGRTFLTGQVAHNAGLTARWRDSRSRFGGERTIDTGLTTLGEPAPVTEFPDTRAARATLRDEIAQEGLGLSYHTAFGKVFKASAGVLYSDYKKQFTDEAGVQTSTESAPWLYNIGAVAAIDDGVEIYGSYSRGLEEAGTAPASASNANTILEATIVTQKELGARLALSPELKLIIAGFDTRKPQAGINGDTGAFEFLGDVTHRGVEASLSGSLDAQISTVIGAVYTDATVTGVNVDSGLVGPRPVNVPTWRAVANLNYKINDDLSFDVGIEYLDQRAAFSRVAGGSQQLLDSTTIIDLGARYRMAFYEHALVVRAQLLNVLNTFAWRSAPGETIDYNPQRSLRVLATVEF